MNILIFGPQASGKGTQAKLLAKKFKFYHFDMGSILREYAKRDKKLDEKINVKGILLEDKETIRYAKMFLEKKFEKIQKIDQVLFDGFPRSVAQHVGISNWLRRGGAKINLAIYLKISKEETIKRLSARRTCSICGRVYNLNTAPPPKRNTCDCGGKLFKRKDDSLGAIKTRLEAYYERTEPMSEYFRNEKILVEIDGEKPIQKIFNDISKIVTGFQKGQK
jgi:adenylate kinase